LRELREESGVEAEILGLVDVVDGLFPDIGRHYVLIDYVAVWTNGEPIAGDDADAAAFFALETAVQMVGWGETRRIIVEAVRIRNDRESLQRC
jgi:8-oxo-dGTP diphosphatase